MAVVSKRGRFLVGELLFERGGRLTLSGGPKVSAGQMALVQLDGDHARVIRKLGRPDRATDVVEALLADRGIRRGFSPKVDAAASDAAAIARERDRDRRDLTELATFTVDPATRAGLRRRRLGERGR